MALPPDYVDGLYRKVLMSVKASNAIPTDDEDYHFQHKFNQDFRDGVETLGVRVTALLHRLRSANFPRNDDVADDDLADFDPLEENGALTDLVDGLLEKASQQIIRFQKGEVDPSPSTAAAPPVVLPTPSSSKVSSRPQDSFEDKIDNSDAPFVSKLRAKLHAASTPDGGNPVDDEDEMYHPYRSEITNLAYQPWQVEPTASHPGMISLDDATYTYVDTVDGLASMLEALQAVPMFAVDLENHSFHSFQGFLCLMQISTWDCDWLVDTLALRSHLHTLNAVFCDPTKLKVLHGADSDIVWLQRDLGIYIVNMFDTGQAARALQYPRFSLAYLLQTHCGVTADKQYQLADWRVRPLDEHMVKYAREDTRYLLFIYEVLKKELLAAPTNLLYPTLSRSQTLCLSVYEKPRVPTADDVSHLCFKLKTTVGLQVITDAQVAIMTQLVLWRDRLARTTDESPGYVCPNAVLMKITKGLPATPAALFRLCNPIPPLVRKHAYDITVLLKQTLAGVHEQGKASVAAQHTVKPIETTVVGSVEVTGISTQLDDFKGWTNVVARKAKACASSSLISPKKPKAARKTPSDDAKARPRLFAPSEGELEGRAVDVLEKVRQAFASKEFVIVDVSGVAASAPTAQPPLTPVPPAIKEDVAVPLSLTEKYPKLKKRKAAEAPATVDTDHKNEEEDKVSSFQPFDYASQTLANSTMDLDIKPEVRSKRKKGGGYNPFVQATDDSGMTAINQKKGYNAPRSSTSR
ncbi:hypothetical protein H310_13657 [Aphanomyces invadans]|uniref:HRDC domain-containing protein n=1 Tax=Aphanomyces invadans TaxID=157072 RepID=A0A024TCP8_9STRA|nr:hypothetical protein H310_13657 [Aphanomyces invadans]ETV91828.1 hypothetical protein H310_13657 [Aphanomyces invadans]|eukprot:XP_008879465.1 hypothetical protein H310_13657 [Aphanomyces invadans]